MAMTDFPPNPIDLDPDIRPSIAVAAEGLCQAVVAETGQGILVAKVAVDILQAVVAPAVVMPAVVDIQIGPVDKPLDPEDNH